MAIWFYEKIRLRRSPWQSLSVMLLLAFLCTFFAFFEGFILQKERDMDDAYDAIPVTIVVSNLTGTQTDDLEIIGDILHYFLSDRYVYGGVEQSRSVSSYVKDLRLKATVYYDRGAGFTERQKLSGVTSVEAAPELSAVSGGFVTYFDGYDAEVFSTDKAVCIVPGGMLETLTPEPDGSYTLALRLRMSPAGTNKAETETVLQVAGTYKSDSQPVYCPFACVAAAQMQLDGKLTGDSLSATVRDNHELEEFRQILTRHFSEVDPSGHQEKLDGNSLLSYHMYAVTVHDETLRSTLNSLNRNLQTLYRLRPVFAVIEIMCSGIAGFFYIHIRRRELAVARSLGTGRLQTVGIAFFEILFLYLPGLALSAAAGAVGNDATAPGLLAASVFAATEAGAVAACMMATGMNGIRILREVE